MGEEVMQYHVDQDGKNFEHEDPLLVELDTGSTVDNTGYHGCHQHHYKKQPEFQSKTPLCTRERFSKELRLPRAVLFRAVCSVAQ
jgi:hypothetical protein